MTGEIPRPQDHEAEQHEPNDMTRPLGNNALRQASINDDKHPLYIDNAPAFVDLPSRTDYIPHTSAPWSSFDIEAGAAKIILPAGHVRPKQKDK